MNYNYLANLISTMDTRRPSVTLQVRLPPEVADALDQIADERMSQYINLRSGSLTCQIFRDCALQGWEINTVDNQGEVTRQTLILDTELDALLKEIAAQYPWHSASPSEDHQR